MNTLIKILLPGSGMSLLSLVVGAMSFIAALHFIFGVEYDVILMSAVEQWVSLTGWATAPLESFATTYVIPWLEGIFSISIRLDETWRFVFVIIGLYFTSSSWPAVKSKQYVTAAFLGVLGFAAALFSSFGSAVEFGEATTRSFYCALFSIVSVFLFEIFVSAWYGAFNRNVVIRVFHIGKESETWLRYLKTDLVAQFQLAMVFIILFAMMIFVTPLGQNRDLTAALPLVTVFLYILAYCLMSVRVVLKADGTISLDRLLRIRAINLSIAAIRTVAWGVFVITLSILKQHIKMPF